MNFLFYAFSRLSQGSILITLATNTLFFPIEDLLLSFDDAKVRRNLIGCIKSHHVLQEKGVIVDANQAFVCEHIYFVLENSTFSTMFVNSTN